MVWSSTTQVVRIPSSSKDDIWARVSRLRSVRKVAPQAVCCYALQGKCMYGQSGCRYLHDVTLVWQLGCQYGTECRCEHPRVGSGGERDRWRTVRGLDQGIMVEAKAQRRQDELRYLETSGCDYDDSDPLWDEVTCALRDSSDDNGASDLPKSVRAKLEAAGQYRIIDEDMVDEWLCLPAETLQHKLRKGVLEAERSYLLMYELREAKAAWDADRKVTERATHGTDEMWRMDNALQRLFDGVCWGDGFSPNAPALHLVDEAARWSDAHLSAARARMLEGRSFLSSTQESTCSSWGSQSGYQWSSIPASIPTGLQELLDLDSALKRCLFLARAWAEQIRAKPEGTGLVELVRRAAKSNEYVLVHHVVNWAGSDVE